MDDLEILSFGNLQHCAFEIGNSIFKILSDFLVSFLLYLLLIVCSRHLLPYAMAQTKINQIHACSFRYMSNRKRKGQAS